MKKVIISRKTNSSDLNLVFGSSISSRYNKVRRAFYDVAKTWKDSANIDIEVADDGRGITYPNKDNFPCTQRVDVKMVPEYHLYNNLQDEILVTTDLSELESTISDVVSEDIK